MHELSLAESVLELIEQTAQREHARRVKTVFVDVGELACVEVSALQFCFASVVKGSVADAAELVIQTIPGQAWCADCQQSTPIHERWAACPQCGLAPLAVTGGMELRVREIEIE